jgi:hypothetical protein
MVKVKNIVLGVGIFIVFLFLLHNGIRVFYAEPEYNDFCPEVRTAEFIDNEVRCVEVGGKWNPDTVPRKVDSQNEQIITGYCDRDFSCRENYENSVDEFEKKVFFIAVVIGLLILIIGVVIKTEPVGSGLMASGVGAIVYGTIVNWENLGNLGRFVLLLIAFILLIWFGFRLNSKNKKSWMFWK